MARPGRYSPCWRLALRVTRVLLRAELNPHPGSRLVATASIELDSEMAVHMIRVVSKPGGGYIVAMPSRRDAMSKFRDYAHPICKSLRGEIEAAVIVEYERQTERKK